MNTNLPQQPLFPDAVPNYRLTPDRLPLGSQLAGVVLIINAIVQVAELFVPGQNDPTSGPFNSPVHLIVNAAIGGALLQNKVKWRGIAIAKVLLGAALFTTMFAIRGDFVTAGFQLVFSAALLGLLVGTPAPARLAVSLTGVVLLFGLEAIGLYAASTGQNPLSRAVLAMKGELDGRAVSEVAGERTTWHLRVPGNQWFLRNREAAAKDNPLADRWLINPSRDAHVLVIAEPLDDGAKVDPDVLAKVVLDNAREAASEFHVVEPSAPLTSPVGPARLAHSASTVNGIKIESYHASFVGKSIVYQVIAFAPAEGFADAAPELKSIISSFTL